MRRNNAGCLNILVSSFSRIILLIFWISRPVQWNIVFGDAWFLACLGFLFLPFTTLVYAFLQLSTPGQLSGLDWVWLALAVVCDLASTASAAYTNRDRIPAGMPGSIENP